MLALYTDLVSFNMLELQQNFHLQCPPLLSHLLLHAVKFFNHSIALQLVYFLLFIVSWGI